MDFFSLAHTQQQLRTAWSRTQGTATAFTDQNFLLCLGVEHVESLIDQTWKIDEQLINLDGGRI